MIKPVLLANLGYPGSGKTFFSRRFAKKHNFFHLTGDIIRLEIFPNASFNKAEDVQLIRIMKFLTAELLSKGISVIFDVNNTRVEYRKDLEKLAKKNKANYLTLWFQTPVELAEKRLVKRSLLKSAELQKYHRAIDVSVLHTIKAEEEYPTAEPHLILKSGLSYLQHEKILEEYLTGLK